MGISNFSFPVFLKLFIVSSGQITLALIGLGLFIGIPLIMLVYNGIKMIFGYKSKRRFIGISSFTLWFGGLILCLIVSLSILSSFSHKLVVPKKTELIQPQNNLLKIYMNKKSLVDSISDEETKFHIGQWNFVSLNGKNFRFGLPELRVVSSENENYQLLVYYSSKGATNEEAKEHINKIEYKFAQNDTALILDPYYLLAENEKWRNQNIKIIIKVPHWKVIYLSPETSSILHYDNDNFDYSKDLAGKKWIMTENGLKEYYSPQVIGASDTTKKVTAASQKNVSKLK
jgi:hypothetical protein